MRSARRSPISGDTFAATAPGAEPGAAYIYVHDAGGWTQQARLTPSGGSTGENFGASVSLSGDRVAVGANRAGGEGRRGLRVRAQRNGLDPGSAPHRVGSGLRDAFGSSVALDADTLLAGAPIKHRAPPGSYANGAVYAFIRAGGGWAQQAKLLPAAGRERRPVRFCRRSRGRPRAHRRAVRTFRAGHRLCFLAHRYDLVRTDATRRGQRCGPATNSAGRVAFGEDRVIVGAPFAGELTGAACGANYVFEGPTFVETGAGALAQPLLNELTGWSVAASGARWVASAPGHEVGINEHAGAAYWFDATDAIFRSGFESILLPPQCQVAD
jgi:hypothetical protein